MAEGREAAEVAERVRDREFDTERDPAEINTGSVPELKTGEDMMPPRALKTGALGAAFAVLTCLAMGPAVCGALGEEATALQMPAKDGLAFTSKPTARADGVNVRIDFEVNKLTDVAVEILDEDGRVVRHLAAGLLGPHAPEPSSRQVQSWWDLFIPQMTSARSMVVTPDEFLLVATVAPDYVTERRPLLKLATDGAIPADAFALRLPPGMHTNGLSIVSSPDCKLLYVSGMATTRPQTTLHVVYRLALDGSNDYSVLFGEEKVAGSDDAHLKDPAGVDVDKQGNVYVADAGNNRVVVVRPDGALLRQFETAAPLALRVGPAGAVYVLSAEKYRYGGWVPKRLTKYSPQGRELSVVDASAKGHFGHGSIEMKFAGLVLADRGGRVTLWVGCTSAPDGCNGYPYGYSHGVVKVADDGRALVEAEFVDMAGEVFAARREEWAKRREREIQRDGYRYGYTMRRSGDPSVVNLKRFDAEGNEAPVPRPWRGSLPSRTRVRRR